MHFQGLPSLEGGISVKRKIFLVAMLSVLALVTISFAANPTYVLKFGTVAAPTQPQVKAMQKFAEIVGELSGGKIEVQVFPSGQLGDQRSMLLATMRGDLDMFDDAGPAWFADLCGVPEMGVLNAAYVFRNVDHMYRVMTGPIGQKFFKELEKKANLHVLDTWYLGTRELDLIKKVGPVKTPADLKGVKLRMPNSRVYLDMGRALGALPTPMDFTDVYLGLKTGTIDGQDNPLPTDYSAKFCEVTHYIVLTDHLIGILNPVINEKLWKSMPEEYHAYINKAMEVARYYMDYMVTEQEAQLIGKFIKDYHMEIVVPNKEAFMENARKFYSQPQFDKVWGKGMYEKIQTSE